MKLNKKLIVAAVAGAIGVGGFALQANAASSITANAKARIAGAISISETTQLNFGGIVGGTAGTVAVPATGGAATFTSVTAADSGATRAVFAITGDTGLTYTVTYPTSFTVGTMTVDTITTSSASGTTTLTGGSDTFYIGGTLHVAGTEANGAYTGTYAVSVAYN